MPRGDQMGRWMQIFQTLILSEHGKSVHELFEIHGFECDQRTVYRDLDAMQFAGFPIYNEVKGRKGLWRLMESAKQRVAILSKLTEEEVVMGGAKYCPKCNLKKPRDDFYNNKSRADGLSAWCKACMLKKMKETRDKGKKNKEEAEKIEPVPVTTRPASNDVVETENTSEMVLDFSGYRELLEEIRDSAGKEFRTPEMQVMYWLNLMASNDSGWRWL